MQNRLVKKLLNPDGTQGGQEGNTPSQMQQNGNTQQASQGGGSQQNQPPAFDYAKLADIVAGKQTVAEDTVLKNYFRNQGMTEEEMKQAISVFKQQKAASQPDVNALQTQIAEEKALAQKAKVENVAIMAGMALGLDVKTIPYILKMADLSSAMDKDGKINEEAVKTSINKVLEDVPQLKPVVEDNKGFRIGGGAQQNPQQNNAIQNPVPTKRWNRFNN